MKRLLPTVNGQPVEVEGHPMERLLDVLRDAARPDRHQGGLRRGRVRRLHGAARRRAGPLLPGAARPVRRAADRDGREHLAERPVRARLRRALRRRPAASSAAPARPASSSPPGAPAAQPDARAARRCARRWPATSAAARATRASCGRSIGTERTSGDRPRARARWTRRSAHLDGDPGLVPIAGCTDLMVREPRSCAADGPGDRPARHPRAARHPRGRRAGSRSAPPPPSPRSARSAAVRAAFPALAEAAASDRRLADPEPRHARRQRRQRQPGGRLAAGAARPGRRRWSLAARAGRAEIPYDELPHRLPQDRPRSRARSIVRVRLPPPARRLGPGLPQGGDPRGAGDQQGGGGRWPAGSTAAGSPTCASPPAASRRRRSACAPPRSAVARPAAGAEAADARRPRRGGRGAADRRRPLDRRVPPLRARAGGAADGPRSWSLT